MSDLDLAIAIAKAKKAKQNGQTSGTPLSPSDQNLLPPEGGGATSLTDQAMSGVNEGIAGILGAPVDLAAGALNLGSKGINAALGTDIKPIVNPVGGGGTFRKALSPTISESPPQNALQRYGRRIGQEIGAMSIPGGAMLRSANAPMRLAATESASALGAGLAGQTAREVAPDSGALDLIASIIGGGAPILAARSARPKPTAPTMKELKAQQASAYDAVDASEARLSSGARGDLIDAMKKRAQQMDMDEFLHPRATRTLSRMESLEDAPKISGIEKKRRLVGRDVAGSLDPSESMIGQGMKDEIDTYLKDLAARGELGGGAAQTLGDLERGRELTQRIKKSEAISALLEKAERRAAGSGTGGNVVNATRQNLRTLLDDPKKARHLSKAEKRQIDDIVRGTGPVNLARLVGRLSPTSGALPLMGNMAAMSGAGAAAGPMGTLIGAAPGAVGMVGKAAAEGLTSRQVTRLLESVRNGGPVAAKGFSQTDVRSLIAALLSQTATPPEGN